MTTSERDKTKERAAAAGLSNLTDAQLAEFAAGAKSMDALVRRLPKDLGGADEMALVFRLTPRASLGDRR